MLNEPTKQYVIKGKVVGTYETKMVDIGIRLSDSELARIKELIKSRSKCQDLRQIVEDNFPELYEQINGRLVDTAYEFYEKEYMDYFAESENDEPGDIELTGEEYSCPIPDEWK